MVYDSVYALANELKQSEEYKQYAAAKAVAFEDASTAALIHSYQKLTLESEMYLAAGQPVPEDTAEEARKLIAILQMNETAMTYLIQESRLNGVMKDVFRILMEAVDINPGLMASDAS